MNRSIFDVLPEFEGRKEFIDNVMKVNGDDIQTAKKNVEDITKERDALKLEVVECKKTITELEESAGDVENLKKTIEDYKAKEKLANEEKQKQIFEANMTERFNAVIKDAEFVNDFTKNGAYEQFKAMVADKSNNGKGDSQIYAELIKGNDSWFKSKQNFVNMQGLGQVDSNLVDAEAFKKMTLIQQMAFANNHPAEYAELSKLV